jgi:hypothetical protein
MGAAPHAEAGSELTAAVEPRVEATWAPRFLAVVGGLTLLHVLLAALTPFSGDEAYYWDCSRHVDWSYFDQPPLYHWVMIPFRLVLGENVLAVRAPAMLASLLAAVFLVPLIRRLGGGFREATWAYLLVHAMPLFFLGSFYASTDVAMSTAYLGATWAAVALAQGEKRAWWGFGIACGLGFLSKFPVVLVAPALIPALLRREVRRQLRTPTPWLALLLSLALTAPVWIWGALHDWDNIVFQLAGRHARGDGFTLEHLGTFIAGNLLLATPFLCIAIFVALWRNRRNPDPGWAAYRIALLMPFLAFGLVSISKHVGMHWAAPGLLLGAVALVLVPIPGRKLWFGLGAATGLAVSLLALVLALFPETVLHHGWLAREGAGDPPGAFQYLIGSRETLEEIERRRQPEEIVVSESYSLVHELGLLSGGRTPTALAEVRGGIHGFASLYWYPPEHWLGRDALYVSRHDDARERLATLFAECRDEEPIVVRRGGREIRRTHVMRCRDLQQPSPAFTRLSPRPAAE